MKAWSHKSTGSKPWADDLDIWLRNAQDKQTNGIPIGPDTSFILGEIILSAVDAAVASRLPDSTRGLRYYDDYALVTQSRATADDALVALQDELTKFDLHLNPRKTSIVELPSASTPSLRWVEDDFPEDDARNRRGAMLDYFERVFEHRRQNPESTVVNFALSRIADHPVSGDTWELVQDLMSQAVTTDPGAMHQYVRTLVELKVKHDIEPDPQRLTETLTRIIERHAPRSHGSEVAWALWSSMAFDVKLKSSAATLVSTFSDDVVALLALEAQARGSFESNLDTTLWSDWMTGEQLYGEHWLFAYEALRRNLLPSRDGTDFIRDDHLFEWLRSNQVRFIKNFRRPTKTTVSDIDAGDDYDEGDEDDEDDEDGLGYEDELGDWR